MRKPVRLSTERVLSVAGGKSSQAVLQRTFECLAGGKLNHLGGFDFDLRSGFRVDSDPGLPVADLECSEADELDSLGFLDSGLDAVNDGVQRAFGVGFAGSKGFLY